MRNLLTIIVFTAFFLTYNKWYNLKLGLENFIIALVFVTLTFLIIKKVFEIIGSYFGIKIEFDRIYLQHKYRMYSAMAEKVYVFVARIPIDLIFLLLFGFATYGYFFPIFVSIKFNPIISKRVGKFRPGVNNIEKLKIIVYSTVALWLIYTVVRNFASYAPILEAFTMFYYRTLMLFTLSSVIPLGLFIAPLTKMESKKRLTNPSIGDILLGNKTYNYITSVILLILLPLLSLYLSPLFFLVVVGIISSIIWLNERFKSALNEL